MRSLFQRAISPVSGTSSTIINWILPAHRPHEHFRHLRSSSAIDFALAMSAQAYPKVSHPTAQPTSWPLESEGVVRPCRSISPSISSLSKIHASTLSYNFSNAAFHADEVARASGCGMLTRPNTNSTAFTFVPSVCTYWHAHDEASVRTCLITRSPLPLSLALLPQQMTKSNKPLSLKAGFTYVSGCRCSVVGGGLVEVDVAVEEAVSEGGRFLGSLHSLV